MSRFTVVYDACVLYPAPLRDTLMRLALTGLFKAHWTHRIHDEWTRAVKRNNPEIDPGVLQRTRELMDLHAADAIVEGYQPLIESLTLPDPDDRHVLATAIHVKAGAIVTSNLKDFPADRLTPYEIEAIHPDEFIYLQTDLSAKACLSTFKAQRADLSNPKMSVEEFIQCLQKQSLPKTVSFLRDHKEFI